MSQTGVDFLLAGIKAQRDQGDGRILLADNTGSGAVMQSCCGRSGSNELKFGLQLGSVIYTYIFDHVITQVRVAPHLPESNSFVRRGLFIYQEQFYGFFYYY